MTTKDRDLMWGPEEPPRPTKEEPPREPFKPTPPPRSLIPRKEEERKELIPFNRDGGDGKSLLPDQLQALVAWAHKYSLDPYAGQVVLYFGQPYVTERGAVANARRDPRYRGHCLSLVPPQEKEAMGLGKEDVSYRCDVFIEGFDHPVTEFGEVTDKEVRDAEAKYRENAQFLPLVKSPGKMARARAIRRAHLLAFPLRGGEEKDALRP